MRQRVFTAINHRALLVLALATCFLLIASSCQDLGQFDITDSDGDGWTDIQESKAGTDPNNVDTDGDEYWDPLDPNPLNPAIPVDSGLPEAVSEPTSQSSSPSPQEDEPEPTTTTAGDEPEVTPEAEDTSPEAAPMSTESKAMEELHKIQEAVKVMMLNNNLTRLESPVTTPTSDMRSFPDDSTKHGIAGVGYALYLHDFNGDGKPDTNYISFKFANGTYTCDMFGNVTQVTTGYE